MVSTMFLDRVDAGRKLAAALIDLRDQPASVVLGIPRGGVLVAREVARILNAPLDIILTHKLGAPYNPELAIGAVSEDGAVFLDDEAQRRRWLPAHYLDAEIERQRQEMARRAELYRRGRARLAVLDQTAIVIDDGVATGSTLVAALRSVRAAGTVHVIAAAPVGPAEVIARLQREADRVIVLATPIDFVAVSSFYRYFDQVSDEEVIAALAFQPDR
jgi:putative phosphoribosyl transferase